MPRKEIILLGWKPFDGVRNRYWLIENLTNANILLFMMLCMIIIAWALTRCMKRKMKREAGILNTLNQLNTVNTENPNLMIIQFFFQGKPMKFPNVFKKGNS